MSPRIVSLFSGYGGLEMGVQAVIGGEVVAHVEFDAAPSRILAKHWPDVPNLGDVTTVDWSEWSDVDVLTGEFPCQDVSLAGLRKGLGAGTRSGLWSEFARAIDELRPRLVVIENVRGLLSAKAHRNVEPGPDGVGDDVDGPVLRALGAVLGDLADLGYDASWCGVRASDACAPHQRFRVFIVAYPADAEYVFGQRGGDARGRWAESADGVSADASSSRRREREDGRAGGEDALPGTWGLEFERGSSERAGVPADSECGSLERRGDGGDVVGAEGARESLVGGEYGHAADDRGSDVAWGEYEPAVRRWEAVTGRVAPRPVESTARNGAGRLSPAFVEWMMGLPAGHVTDAGLTRSQQLKALGNGVVPQQAELAIRHLLEREVAA